MVSNLLLPQPPKLQYFDQIDDDFPYDIQTLSPNTRTYIRPGAMLALYATRRGARFHRGTTNVY